MPTPPILSSLIAGKSSNGNASSTQYFVMIGATFVSMNVRTCFTTASSSGGKRLGEFVEVTVRRWQRLGLPDVLFDRRGSLHRCIALYLLVEFQRFPGLL